MDYVNIFRNLRGSDEGKISPLFWLGGDLPLNVANLFFDGTGEGEDDALHIFLDGVVYFQIDVEERKNLRGSGEGKSSPLFWLGCDMPLNVANLFFDGTREGEDDALHVFFDGVVYFQIDVEERLKLHITTPSNSETAVSTSSFVSKETNPYPADLPDGLSKTTLAETGLNLAEKNSLRLPALAFQ
ncbi:hypothetical protein M5K25_026220 [Dendrobium thyrsiflorum]|uniref:Uncharacterized protein n=1 Tax=Dendrobium thyrsiflorum TaxID=117978 RepID=A0ABD0TWR7_DENTH